MTVAIVFFGMSWTATVGAETYQNGMATTAQSLLKKIEAAGELSGTVLDFVDLQGNATELGKFVAQDFSDDIFSEAVNFALVDRSNLQQLLKENKMTVDGLIDPSTSPELGKLVGIDSVILGTVTPIGASTFKLSVRAIAIASGKVVSATSATLPMDSTLSAMSDHGVAPPASTSASASSDGSLQGRLLPSSIKLTARQLMVASVYTGRDGLLEYTIENNSGMSLAIGIESGSYSAGACSNDFDDYASGLPIVSDSPYSKRPVVVPNSGKVNGTLDFNYNSCNTEAVKGTSAVPVAMTVVLSYKNEVVRLPLSADSVPVHIQ